MTTVSDASSTIAEWESESDICNAFQIGKAEARAALMLKTKTDPDFVAFLTNAVKVHGFSANGKAGVITHDALTTERLDEHARGAGY